MLGIIEFLAEKSEHIHVATATTVEEAEDLAATGFDYLTRMDGVQMLRKPKCSKSIGTKARN